MLNTIVRLAAGAVLILAWPALAAPRTWVASFGSGATCSRSAPCADFQTAYNATDAGGEINCLDSGGDNTFGGFTIRKSITIDCAGTASPGKSSGDILIDAPGIVVTLRNLAITTRDDLNGSGLGVWFLTGNALHVENCRIANFKLGAAGNAIGIKFAPGAGVTGALFVSDTIFTDNGLLGSGGGIIIQPAGSGSARVMLNRVRMENNTYGIFANGTGSTGLVVMQVRDSLVTGSGFHGISAFTAAGHSTVSITVDHTSSIISNQGGILAQGAGAFVIVGNSTVLSNGTGLLTADGGSIFTYQNNQLSGNLSDGAATGALTMR
jgi:hypothetical protein